MRMYQTILVIFFSFTLTLGNETTRSIIVNNTRYIQKDKVLINGSCSDMTCRFITDEIFFTYLPSEPRLGLMKMDKDLKLTKIDVNGVGQAAAVDNNNDIVYLGTDTGLYKYENGKTELIQPGEDVMYIASNNKDTIYIATYPNEKVHKINKGFVDAIRWIPEGKNLVIDNEDNLYFIASYAPYVLKRNETMPVRIKGLPYDKIVGFFVVNNTVLAMDENSSLYKIDSVNDSAEYLGSFSVRYVGAFAIDSKNNVYIGSRGVIRKFEKACITVKL